MTLLNGQGVAGYVAGPPAFTPTAGTLGALLDVGFDYSPVLWPWTGYLALRIRVRGTRCALDPEP